MPIRVGINDFGPIGRLAFRALANRPELDFEAAHGTETAADAAWMAHLTEFDSVHGRWRRSIAGKGDTLMLAGGDSRFTQSDSDCARSAIDGCLVKMFVWYSNQWGYAQRLVELVSMISRA